MGKKSNCFLHKNRHMIAFVCTCLVECPSLSGAASNWSCAKTGELKRGGGGKQRGRGGVWTWHPQLGLWHHCYEDRKLGNREGRVQWMTSGACLGLTVFQLGKLDRERERERPPPSFPPTHHPTTSSPLLSPSSTLFFDLFSSQTAWFFFLSTSFPVWVCDFNAMCFLMLAHLYVTLSFKCLCLCLHVCLLLIRSLWPRVSIERVQKAGALPLTCIHTRRTKEPFSELTLSL